MDDDCSADENCPGALDATAILHCLKFLAQEAAALKLVRTLSAIEDALDTAAWEGIAAGERHGTPAPQMIMH